MKKASKELIKFYKGVVLTKIVDTLNEDIGEVISIQHVDTLLKDMVNIDMSCIEMSEDELYEVIYKGFEMGDAIGLTLGFPSDLEPIDKL